MRALKQYQEYKV